MKMTEAKEKENQESGLIETEREESLTKQADTSCRGQVRKKKTKNCQLDLGIRVPLAFS